MEPGCGHRADDWATRSGGDQNKRRKGTTDAKAREKEGRVPDTYLRTLHCWTMDGKRSPEAMLTAACLVTTCHHRKERAARVHQRSSHLPNKTSEERARKGVPKMVRPKSRTVVQYRGACASDFRRVSICREPVRCYTSGNTPSRRVAGEIWGWWPHIAMSISIDSGPPFSFFSLGGRCMLAAPGRLASTPPPLPPCNSSQPATPAAMGLNSRSTSTRID